MMPYQEAMTELKNRYPQFKNLPEDEQREILNELAKQEQEDIDIYFELKAYR